MAERVNTVMRGGSRFYVHPGHGEKLPGVTSVINMLPKPFLVGWASKMAAEFVVDNIGSVMPLALSDRTAAIDLIKGASRRYTRAAGEIGTEAHELFEKLARGQNVPRQHPDMQPFVDHYKAFLDKWQPEFVALEETVWNSVDGYAGSFDAIVKIGGETLILDNKTTKSGVHSEVALQLAAYRYGRTYLNGEALPQIDAGAVLHIRPEGWQLVPVRCDEPIFEAFKNLLKVFEWDSLTQRNVVGKAL